MCCRTCFPTLLQPSYKFETPKLAKSHVTNTMYTRKEGKNIYKHKEGFSIILLRKSFKMQMLFRYKVDSLSISVIWSILLLTVYFLHLHFASYSKLSRFPAGSNSCLVIYTHWMYLAERTIFRDNRSISPPVIPTTHAK